MKILVDRLSETPSPYDFRVEAGWWEQRFPAGNQGAQPALGKPFEIHVDAHVMGEDIFLAGKIEGALELECGRCLARYRHAFQEAFQLVAEPAGTRVPGDPEAVEALSRDGLCLGDEMSVGWYRDQGTELCLDALILEVISLALPVQPLCREGCAGLCSRCGAELSQGPCGCTETDPSSPFAVLAALKGGSEGVH